MDWLGDIGGVLEALTILFAIIIGGYLAYNSAIETMSVLYYTSSGGAEDEKFYINTCDRLFLYAMHSLCIFKCCCKGSRLHAAH